MLMTGLDSTGAFREIQTNSSGQLVTSGVNTGKQSSATITLANDTAAHHAGDVVSTAAGAVMSFSSLGVAGDIICILGSRVKYSGSAVPTASTGYRLHLYDASPTAIADNAAFNVIAADLAKYLGYINISVLTDVGDNCITVDDNINFTCKLAGTGLYGQLQCIAAETPAINCVFTVLLNTVVI